jgi:hypothetical protein
MKRTGTVRRGEVRKGKDAFLRETGGFRAFETLSDFDRRQEQIAELQSKIRRRAATPADIELLSELLGNYNERDERIKKD